MSANNFQPHVVVIPEDGANRQLLTGFQLEFPTRQIHREPEAGGWLKVRECFEEEHIAGMRKYEWRIVLLLVDFDGQNDRLEEFRSAIPEDLEDRVFVLGAWTEPQDLTRAGLGSFETIGRSLAKDCRDGTEVTWGHTLLRHNASEVARFCERVRSILGS